jgi:hypothetical protein
MSVKLTARENDSTLSFFDGTTVADKQSQQI